MQDRGSHYLLQVLFQVRIVHLKKHLHQYFVGLLRSMIFNMAGPGGLLQAPAFRPFGVTAYSALLKFAPGEFVEPLSVQTLPVEAANQLL